MPATTPTLALPYPVPNDTVDVPRDVKALADRLEIVLATISASKLIATQTLSSAGTFTFSSIPQTYTHLQLVASLRSSQTVGGGLDTVFATFNGDSTASYVAQGLFAAETTATAFAFPGETGARLGTCGDATLPNNWSPLEVNIPGYRQAGRKQWQTAGYAPIVNLAGRIAFWGGQWVTGGAITAIRVGVLSGGNFATGSICSLYGIA